MGAIFWSSKSPCLAPHLPPPSFCAPTRDHLASTHVPASLISCIRYFPRYHLATDRVGLSWFWDTTYWTVNVGLGDLEDTPAMYYKEESESKLILCRLSLACISYSTRQLRGSESLRRSTTTLFLVHWADGSHSLLESSCLQAKITIRSTPAWTVLIRIDLLGLLCTKAEGEVGLKRRSNICKSNAWFLLNLVPPSSRSSWNTYALEPGMWMP